MSNKLDSHAIHSSLSSLQFSPQEFQNKLQAYVFHPFIPSENPNIIAGCSDGSFNCLWQITHSTDHGYYHRPIYFGIVQASIIETKYDNMIEKKYVNQYATNMFDVLINLEKTFRLGVDTMLNKLMNRYELFYLCKYAKEHTNRIIMLDGSLYHGSLTQAESDQDQEDREEFKTLMKSVTIISKDDLQLTNLNMSLQDLVQICQDQHHILVGVTKESFLLDEQLHFPYELAIRQASKLQHLSPDQLWYLPIHNVILPNKKPIHILFAKLHPRAIKWHRIDWIDTGFDLEKEILPVLSQFAQYNKF